MKTPQPTGSRSTLPLGPRVQAVLEWAYRARKPVLLEGPTGIGKSEIVASTAAALGVDLAVLDLSLLEPSDLVGLPFILEGRTHFACPDGLPRAGKGLLMLEELNRAERFVQNPALQLLTARRLHGYCLPEGWSAVAAINPEGEAYQVEPMDPALRGRFLQLKVVADRAAWLTWARRQRLHPAVMQIARTHDRLFDEVPPRTWSHVSDLLLEKPRKADDRLIRDALGGYLPPTWLECLIQAETSLRVVDHFRAADLLAGYARNRTAQRTLVGYRDQGRTDLLDVITDRVETLLHDHGESALLIERDRLELASFERLLEDLPGDQALRLQIALGKNPWAFRLLGVQPAEVLERYRGSSTALAVSQWLGARRLRHRAWALVTAVTGYLTQHPERAVLCANPAVREGVAHLLAQLAAERTALAEDPVAPALRSLNLTADDDRRAA